MQVPAIPDNELHRIQALYDTGLLDTDADARFDRLTRLVKYSLGSQIVLISLVDTKRQWFKSCQGIAVVETSRDISFCGHAILGEDIFEIPDARLDPRFSDNPLVTGAPYIRFYAGAPLNVKGYRIGTLCLIDSEPRLLNNLEREALRDFADAIQQEIIDQLNQLAQAELVQSELRQRFVLEGAYIGTWQWNILTGETVFNERWAQIVGYTLAELAPLSIDTWLGLVHPEDLPISEQLLQRHFSQELPLYDLMCRMRHKDGHWVWVHDKGKVIHWTDDGKPLMMYGTHVDISEQKQQELALRESREQLLKLTEQLPGMLYQFQQWPDGRVAFPYASAGIEQIYFVSAEQVQQDASVVLQQIHPDDMQLLTDSINESFEQLTPWQLAYRVIRPDGTVCWLHGRSKPEKLPDDSVIWHGYIYDITQIKQFYLELEEANSQLQVTQQRLDVASQNAKIGFWQLTLKTGALWWSAMMYEILAVVAADTIPDNMVFKSVIHPDDLAKVTFSEQKAQQDGMHEVVHRIIRPKGDIRWVHQVIRCSVDKDDGVIMVGSVQDITERLQLQRLKDEFISTVSHELRTPITAIKGALSLLVSGVLQDNKPQIDNLLHIAHNNSEQLSKLINDLLDIEKLTAGKMIFNFQRINVSTALQQTLSNLEPYAKQYSVTLALTEMSAPLFVWADALRLQQVLSNLLSNAIKFSHKYSQVRLTAQLKGNYVELAVHDQGVGIAAAFQSRIFERFAQADGSNSRQSGGTGLGLAICKELAEQMHGRIGFISRAGQGSSFYIALPLSESEADNGIRVESRGG